MKLIIDGVKHNVIEVIGNVRAQTAPGQVQLNVGLERTPTSAHVLPEWFVFGGHAGRALKTSGHTYTIEE